MRTKRKPAIALLLAINDEKKKNNRIHALKIDESDEDESVDESDHEIGKHLLDSLIKKGDLERVPHSKIPKPGDTLLEQKYNELFHVFTKVMEEIYTSGNTISLKDSGSYPTKGREKEREVEVSVEVDVSTEIDDHDHDHHDQDDHDHDHSIEVDVDVNTKIDDSFEPGETINISVEEDIEIGGSESDESIIVEVNEKIDQPMRETIEVDVDVDVDVDVEDESGDLTSAEYKNQLKTKKKKQKSRKKKYGMSYIQDQLKMLLGVDCDCKEEDFDLSTDETRIYEIRDKKWYPIDSDEMLTSVIKVPREASTKRNPKEKKEKKRTSKLNEANEMKKKKSKKLIKETEEIRQKEKLDEKNDQVKEESGETKIKNLEKKVEKLQKYWENQMKKSKAKEDTAEMNKEKNNKNESKKNKLKKSFETNSFEVDYDDLDDLDSILPIPIVPRKPAKKTKTPKKVTQPNKKSTKNKKEEDEAIVADDLKYFRDLAEKMDQFDSEKLSNRHAKRSYRNWRKGTVHQEKDDEKTQLFLDQRSKQDNEFYENKKQPYGKVQSSWSTGDNYSSNGNNEDETLFTAIAQEMGLDLSQTNSNVTAQLFKLYRKYSHLLDTDGGSEYIRRLTAELESPLKSGRIKLIPEQDEIRKILSEANIDLDELLAELQQILGIEVNTKNENGYENDSISWTSKISENLDTENKPNILKLM